MRSDRRHPADGPAADFLARSLQPIPLHRGVRH